MLVIPAFAGMTYKIVGQHKGNVSLFDTLQRHVNQPPSMFRSHTVAAYG